jgi:hypothetical protein
LPKIAVLENLVSLHLEILFQSQRVCPAQDTAAWCITTTHPLEQNRPLFQRLPSMAWHEHRVGTNLPLLHPDFARAQHLESRHHLAEHNAVNGAQASLANEPDDASTLELSMPWDYDGLMSGWSLRGHSQNASFFVRASAKLG